MKISKGSFIKDTINEINEYNEAVKQGKSEEDLASVLERLCNKNGIDITDEEIKNKANEINPKSSDDIDDLLKLINKKIDEIENQK